MTPNAEVTNSEKKIDLSFDKKEVFISFFCWNLRGKNPKNTTTKKRKKNSGSYIKKNADAISHRFLDPISAINNNFE